MSSIKKWLQPQCRTYILEWLLNSRGERFNFISRNYLDDHPIQMFLCTRISKTSHWASPLALVSLAMVQMSQSKQMSQKHSAQCNLEHTHTHLTLSKLFINYFLPLFLNFHLLPLLVSQLNTNPQYDFISRPWNFRERECMRKCFNGQKYNVYQIAANYILADNVKVFK